MLFKNPISLKTSDGGIKWPLVIAVTVVSIAAVWIYGFGGAATLVDLFSKKKSGNGNGVSGKTTSGDTPSASSTSSSSGNSSGSASSKTDALVPLPTAFTTPTNQEVSTLKATPREWGFPLHKGVGKTKDPSIEVACLQVMANYYLKDDIGVDGAWGPKTEEAMSRLVQAIRLDNKGNSCKWQFADYIVLANGQYEVSADHYRSLCGYEESILGNDLKNGLNANIK